MARSRKGFKKFNRNLFVEGTQLNVDNLVDVAITVGGVVCNDGAPITDDQAGAIYNMDADLVTLAVPTLDGVKHAHLSDYVFYENNRLAVLDEDEFETLYIVGNDKKTREAAAADNEENA